MGLESELLKSWKEKYKQQTCRSSPSAQEGALGGQSTYFLVHR